MNTQLTPVTWQKFGDDYCLTGQFGRRPIFLSVGRKSYLDISTGKGVAPGLRLLDEKGLLIPFTPDHPHAQRIVDGWNNADAMIFLEKIKLTALRMKNAQAGLAHIVRLCIDAGVKIQLDELKSKHTDELTREL